MRTYTTLAIGLVMTGSLFAQTEMKGGSETELKDQAMLNAQARTTQLTQELGLTEVQALTALKSFQEAETAVIPDRQQCDQTMQRMNTTLEGAYAPLIATLTPEQAAKLDALRKSGAEKAGCTGASHGTPGKGCCAGGKAATGKTASSAATITTSEEPAKR